MGRAEGREMNAEASRVEIRFLGGLSYIGDMSIACNPLDLASRLAGHGYLQSAMRR
jgi:hypothetical protein